MANYSTDFTPQTAKDIARGTSKNSGAQVQRTFSKQERLEALADFYAEYRGRYPDAAEAFFRRHPELGD